MRKFKKICLLIICLLSVLCVSCGEDTTNATKISFKSAQSYEDLKTMDGKMVQINGYLATSSPVDGSFIFLMNLPYQSCPFCVPNTSTLSNTIEVYPKKNKTFSYTSQAVKVVGKLEVAEDENSPFSDEYGYEFNFKIIDATYKILKDSDLSQDIQTWNKIAEADIVNDIYKMYDYLYFLVFWPSYYVNSYYDSEGNYVYGYYLWAEDAKKSILEDDGQFHYGRADNYFENIISSIEKIDANVFADLVANIKKAEELATKAYNDLINGEYTYVYQYVEKFGTTDYVYTLKNKDTLQAEYKEVYTEFSNWLSSWEM